MQLNLCVAREQDNQLFLLSNPFTCYFLSDLLRVPVELYSYPAALSVEQL